MPRLLALLLAIVAGSVDAQPPYRAGRSGHHGAIAYHAASGNTGFSFDFRDSRAAKRAALDQCAQPECVVVVSFRNACGALFAASAKGFAATGATRQEAEAKARARCASRECELVAWSCTK